MITATVLSLSVIRSLHVRRVPHTIQSADYMAGISIWRTRENNFKRIKIVLSVIKTLYASNLIMAHFCNKKVKVNCFNLHDLDFTYVSTFIYYSFKFDLNTIRLTFFPIDFNSPVAIQLNRTPNLIKILFCICSM